MELINWGLVLLLCFYASSFNVIKNYNHRDNIPNIIAFHFFGLKIVLIPRCLVEGINVLTKTMDLIMMR